MGLWNTKLTDMTVGDYTKVFGIYPSIIAGVIIGAMALYAKIEEKKFEQQFEELNFEEK